MRWSVCYFSLSIVTYWLSGGTFWKEDTTLNHYGTCMYADLEVALYQGCNVQDDYICSVGRWSWMALCQCFWWFSIWLKLSFCLFCCSKWRGISGHYDRGYMNTRDPGKKKLHCIFCCKIFGHSRQQLHIFVKEITKQGCKWDLLL